MSNVTLPYERGDIIETTADDLRKLERPGRVAGAMSVAIRCSE